MSLKRIFIAFIFVFGILIAISPVKVCAEETFKTDLSVFYTFNADGKSSIIEQYAVTNLTSRYLISNYEYQIAGEVPGHLTGKDSGGPLVIQTQKLDSGQTLIRVIFNHVVPGKNRTLYFSLSHDGPDVKLTDDIRKILIPKISNPEQLNNYTVTLKVPSEYGTLSYSFPDPVNPNPETEAGYHIFTFAGKPVFAGEISAIFGNFQIKKYILNYRLSNPGDIAGTFSLLLPSQVSGQKVFIKSIIPVPVNVLPDNYGNWIAVYKLSANSVLAVVVSGQVQLANRFQNLIFNISSENDSLKSVLPLKSEVYPDVYIEPQDQLSIIWLPPVQVLPFIENRGLIEIKNTGLSAVVISDFKVRSQGFEVIPGFSQVFTVLPYGYIRIPVSVQMGLSEILQTKYLSLTAGVFSVTYNIPYNLFFVTYGIITFILAFSFLGLAAFAFRAWGLHLQKRGK